ncbi:MAG: phosphoglycerate mutase [Nitrosospira sp.]|nr:phosphoglycerate mutase [Nitrosospira sp.]
MNLHLLVPALFWPDTALPEVYRDLPLPGLENMLARNSRADDDTKGIEAWLCSAFNVAKQLDWPVAPITLKTDGAEHMQAEDSYWIRADPVHLRIDRNQIVLADSRVFPISSHEAGELTSLLNRHFAGENPDLAFLPLQPDRWYLRVAKMPPAQTHPISEVANRGINELLPFGPNNTIWRGLFNDVQMLLHEHPLNQLREARGTPAINATWFWGGGILPESLVSPYTHVWSNEVLARSLALACGRNQAPLPPSAKAWRQAAASGNHLIVLSTLHGKAQYEDAYNWRESLKELEQSWFGPLGVMLRQGELDQVTLTALDTTQSKSFTVRRGDWKKFWRRRKPLSTYAG